ncbi:DUF6491 family protein [Phenylobacterium aquaticum]|uniref:DUF6491 family protein n=1 Tax=Phenylobacterium aquaticum TaxID=1763816 RepID=UPI0026EE4028|nr:DUF6491 family protein [Phenylobacterium aquaticum]
MRKTLLTGVLAAGALITLGGAGPAPARQACFWTSQADGFTAPDDHTVFVRVGVREVYRLDLMGACPNIQWNNGIGLESRPGSSICSAMEATIISHGPTGPERCAVSQMSRLTPAEIAALPKRSRP